MLNIGNNISHITSPRSSSNHAGKKKTRMTWLCIAVTRWRLFTYFVRQVHWEPTISKKWSSSAAGVREIDCSDVFLTNVWYFKLSDDQEIAVWPSDFSYLISQIVTLPSFQGCFNNRVPNSTGSWSRIRSTPEVYF